MKRISTLFLVLMALMALPFTASAEDVTFDFQNNNGNWSVGEGVNFADGNVTSLTWNSVVLTGIQGESANPPRIMKNSSRGICLWLYKGTSVKFNAPEGKAITKIAVTMQSGTFDLTASTGAVAENAWTGNATEVVFGPNANGTRYVWAFVVTLADENDETVKPASYDVEAADIATFNATEDGKIVKLTLDNARVNAANDGKYYVEDASGATVISGVTLSVGKALNGYIIGTKSTNDNIDLVNDPSVAVEYMMTVNSDESSEPTFESSDAVMTGTVKSIADIQAQDFHGRLVTLENISKEDIEGNEYMKKLKDANGNSIRTRDLFGVLPSDYTWPEKISKITGVVLFYYTNWFIMPISKDAIVDAASGAGTAKFDFVNNNMELPIGKAGTYAEQSAGDLGGKSVTIDGVTLKFVNAMTMPTRYYVNGDRGNQFQAISGGQMRITAPKGFAVTAIRSIANPGKNPTTGATTYSTAWKVEKGGGTLTANNQETQTWAGNAESVLLSSTAATYLNAIEVDYAPVTAETALLANEVEDTYAEANGLAAFNEAASNTLVKLTLTNAIITSGMINNWGYYIQDANAGAHLYCTGLDFEVGDVLNGVVYVKKNNQTMGARICMTEKTNAEELTITKNGTVTPVEGSITETNVDANKCRVIKLTGVAVKGTSETAATVTDAANNTINVNNGKTNYFPYVIQESLAEIDYSNATVVGILYGTSSGNQIMPLSITASGTDGIANINAASQENAVIYNLQGVRMDKMQKGINIVNGRKVVMK